MDRLSELPELIQLHILSFLSMRYVVRTSILSKRWRHLWTIVQVLYFSTKGFFPYQNFVDFVNQTLFHRGTYKIRKFRIKLYVDGSRHKDCDEWILYAVKNNVEELFLEFYAEYFQWLLPQCVCCNSSLKTLRLFSCRIIPDMQISWKVLTKLTLRFSVLWDESIRKIMLGAPKLEFLELFSCWGYNDLILDFPSLRVLIVCEYKSEDYESDDYEPGPVMRISAPNVQTLSLSGSFYRKCVLMNVPSVIHATLGFRPDRKKENLKWQQENLMALVRRLRHVESLTLGAWCIEVLAQREERRIPYHISTHQCVMLNIHMTEDDILGTVNLLKGSPGLQKLIIDMEFKYWEEPRDTQLADSENFCNPNYLASQAKNVKCLLHHLKTVKVTQFVDEHSIFPFLEFILKNGKVLENLVIIAKREDANSTESLLKVARRLLSLPRASSRAVVTLLN